MSKEAQKKSFFSKNREDHDEPQPPIPGMPLFFREPAPLDAARHRKAGILPAQDFSFARGTNSVPLTLIEFTEAAKYYPIVFSNDEAPIAVAVVGLEQQNYFVDEKGWKAGWYIPGYVRKYPFIFMEVPERDQLVLCVDEASSQYRENGGQGAIAFYEGDQPSELTRGALEFCSMFQGHYQLMRQFCEAMKAADLLSPTQSDAKLYNGREIHMGGFQVIDEAKLNALPDEKIMEFRKSGFLPFIYFALMSASNWQRLVDIAADRERKKSLN